MSAVAERDILELHAFHDGELGWWRRRRLEARLARSPALRAELASLRRIGQSLRELDARAGAPDLWAGVEARLRQGEARPPRAAESAAAWRPAAWRPVWAGLAVAAAAALALFLWLEPGARPGSEPAATGSRIAGPPAPGPGGAAAAPEPTRVARAPRSPAAPAAPDEPQAAGTGPPRSVAGGAVRSIDTGGRPVMVLDGDRDTTIIWLIGAPRSEVLVRGTSEL